MVKLKKKKSIPYRIVSNASHVKYSKNQSNLIKNNVFTFDKLISRSNIVLY